MFLLIILGEETEEKFSGAFVIPSPNEFSSFGGDQRPDGGLLE